MVNWFVVAYLETLLLVILGIPGVMWLKDWVDRTIRKMDRIIVLRKNGTYDLIKKNLASKKTITIDELERQIPAKAIFVGPMGSLVILPETSSEAIRADKLEIQSDIEPEDLTTVGKLSFFAGQISIMRNKFQEMLPTLVLASLVLSGLAVVMIFKMQNDFNAFMKNTQATLNAIRAALGK